MKILKLTKLNRLNNNGILGIERGDPIYINLDKLIFIDILEKTYDNYDKHSCIVMEDDVTVYVWDSNEEIIQAIKSGWK